MFLLCIPKAEANIHYWTVFPYLLKFTFLKSRQKIWTSFHFLFFIFLRWYQKTQNWPDKSVGIAFKSLKNFTWSSNHIFFYTFTYMLYSFWKNQLNYGFKDLNLISLQLLVGILLSTFVAGLKQLFLRKDNFELAKLNYKSIEGNKNLLRIAHFKSNKIIFCRKYFFQFNCF